LTQTDVLRITVRTFTYIEVIVYSGKESHLIEREKNIVLELPNGTKFGRAKLTKFGLGAENAVRRNILHPNA
jgi:hypothetical protein